MYTKYYGKNTSFINHIIQCTAIVCVRNEISRGMDFSSTDYLFNTVYIQLLVAIDHIHYRMIIVSLSDEFENEIRTNVPSSRKTMSLLKRIDMIRFTALEFIVDLFYR